ncbi:restriction endonuclease [Erysipelothrix rhusiopathiae]|nr:restriction endonuclease [Erysipelothrix rhusiopathiae]
MSEYFEQIYDSHVTEEKLKTGTKFERLTAIVFKILEMNSAVIHDLRLRGENKSAKHQIDVYVELNKNRKRILIECKDYSKVVGISVVRDFYGVVSRIKPDQSIVVSSIGFTKGAINFAKDEDISLVILREFKDSDWDGIIRRIDLKTEFLFMENKKINIEGKAVSNKTLENSNENRIGMSGEINTNETFIYSTTGAKIKSFNELMNPIFNSERITHGKVTKGTYILIIQHLSAPQKGGLRLRE